MVDRRDNAVRDAGGLLAAKLVDIRMGDPRPMKESLEVVAETPMRIQAALIVLINTVAAYAEQTPPKLEGLVDYFIREVQRDE